MPYCPECRDEFEDWVKVCPDCNVPLVDTLPPESEPVTLKGDLVKVATVMGDIEAQLWKGILEDNGIRSMVKVTQGLNIYMPSITLEHEIYVLENDEQQAREILGDISA